MESSSSITPLKFLRVKRLVFLNRKATEEPSAHHPGREPQSCMCPSPHHHNCFSDHQSLTFSRSKELSHKWLHHIIVTRILAPLLGPWIEEMHRQTKCRQSTNCFSILGSKSLAMPYQVEIQERPALLIVLFYMENGHMYSNKNHQIWKKCRFQMYSPFPHVGLHCVLSHHHFTVILTPCRTQKVFWRNTTCSWRYLTTAYPNENQLYIFTDYTAVT